MGRQNSIQSSTKPTIMHVAQLANVSPTTVSLILNHPGKHRYSKQTQKLVKEVCERIGYKANAIAKGLVTRSNAGIGLLCESLDDPNVARAVNEAVRVAANSGCHLVISTEPERTPWEHLVEEGRVDKIISIGGNLFSNPQRPVPVACQKNLIVINEAILPKKDHYFIAITWDGRQHGNLVIDHLFSLGHREIAVLAGFCLEPLTSAPRIAGAYERAIEKGLEVRWITDPEEKSSCIYVSVSRMLDKLFDHYPDVTAILCRKDDQAVAVYRELHRRGKRIPEDIAVVGNFNLQSRFLFDPPLTSVESPLVSATELAVRIAINPDEVTIRNIDLTHKVKLIVRGSTVPQSVNSSTMYSE